MKNLCIFEDAEYASLLPLVYFRPVYELRCGIRTLREKITPIIPHTNLFLHCRLYLKDVFAQSNPDKPINTVPSDECLFVNGAWIADSVLAEALFVTQRDTIFQKNGRILAARLSAQNLKSLKTDDDGLFEFNLLNHLPTVEWNADVITYPWHLVQKNGSQIEKDFISFTANESQMHQGNIHDGVIMLCPERIFIAQGAKIKPGVILDAEEGPIYIGKNAHIMHNAVIIGPAFIGERSAIKIGAKIYENTSIGEVCKVGGEVEGSILHAYANKQHEGFLGHAYVCPWVNLGADTNNSDLKNNYGNVKVTINGKSIDSGSMFVGLTIGDHSKSAINTMFNTGTVVGVSSNVFGTGFPPKYVPSFSWGGSDELVTYQVHKAIDVAKRVMARRKITLSNAEELLFHKIFELTKFERS